ncbi:superoxide dismutase family protein [Kitasatospora sp. NBC_01246]|uniref:hypothetical protein n=1 Tax=Kitasatospora sp. NBC_01246 TaxID=2903570 RepID=UPI002E3646D9|nr:hypothetical protein [Kitasatospora sp. NBC_01246]
MNLRHLAAPLLAAVLLGAAGAPAFAHEGTGIDEGRTTTPFRTSAFLAPHQSSFTLAILLPVPTNHVHSVGTATVQLNSDNTARIAVNATGLLNGAPHAMHIHEKGNGECPTADAAGDHNGHQAISTTDGLPAYGPIGTSLTTTGDTSPGSALAVDRFPSSGTFHYSRTIQLTSDVAQQVRNDNAVVVVHGIDYNGNGRYDNVLGASELNPALPQEATAPALCGPLH